MIMVREGIKIEAEIDNTIHFSLNYSVQYIYHE